MMSLINLKTDFLNDLEDTYTAWVGYAHPTRQGFKQKPYC